MAGGWGGGFEFWIIPCVKKLKVVFGIGCSYFRVSHISSAREYSKYPLLLTVELREIQLELREELRIGLQSR